MKDDKELEMLLDDISDETSHNLDHYDHDHVHGDGLTHRSFVKQYDNDMWNLHHHHSHVYPCVSSPLSVFSLKSNGSSSSLFSVDHSLPENGPTTTPSMEELKSHMPSRTSLHPRIIPDSPFRNNTNERLIDELGLCRNLGKMYISDDQQQQQNDASSFTDFLGEQDRILLGDGSSIGSNRSNADVFSIPRNFNGAFFNNSRFRSPVTRNAVSSEDRMSPTLLGLQQECRMGNLLNSQFSPAEPGHEIGYCNSPMRSPWHNIKEQASKHYQIGSPVARRATTYGRTADVLFQLQPNRMNFADRFLMNLPNSEQVTIIRPSHSSVEGLMFGMPVTNGMTGASSSIRLPQAHPNTFLTSDDSFLIHGEGLNYVINPKMHQNMSASRDMGLSLDRPQQDGRCWIAQTDENSWNRRMCFPFFQPSKCNSLAEAQGYIGLLAKDQHGCRFLQRILEECPPEDVKIIFDEVIGNMVELMMNPFGNYLMQKLLDVCNEEQRMQILLMVTAEPGELVRISLNTHGTRAVQKLIATLKTRHQISLLTLALEPGFLMLTKDQNGNHVVQRCLQCLSNDDNKFIFDGAAKYCVNIATHQHGCCVLQRCISHSTGEHRENLVSEISGNALLLAQDAYGNYVVQYILDLRIPSATSTIVSQFEGKYVHLSTQKFSSHVVEKCLETFDRENQSLIIHELLSVTGIERLLQDPHANYVVQKALAVSEGHLHNLLIEAIEPHKGVSRDSPYSKRIFSRKLLKK